MKKQKFHGKGISICYDAYQILPKLKPNSVDLVFIDPHYNLGAVSKGSLKFKDREDMNKVVDWDEEVIIDFEILDSIRRVLKPTGNVAIWCAYHQFGEWHVLLDKHFSPYDEAFDVVVPFYWCKTNAALSLRKKNFIQATEIVIIGRDKGSYLNFVGQSAMKNWFSCGICQGHERVKGPDGKTLHPAQKPLKVYDHLIEVLCPPGGTVLDFFAGVSTTAVSAVRTGRKFICVEHNHDYYEAGLKRIEAAIVEST